MQAQVDLLTSKPVNTLQANSTFPDVEIERGILSPTVPAE
jgi:hypothetical protein